MGDTIVYWRPGIRHDMFVDGKWGTRVKATTNAVRICLARRSAERYRNEHAVGHALQAAFKAGTIRRENVFVTKKLLN
jgi:diketogulonate reductase-like aldo/keto reductase